MHVVLAYCNCNDNGCQIQRAETEREARKKEPQDGVEYVDFDGEAYCRNAYVETLTSWNISIPNPWHYSINSINYEHITRSGVECSI